MLEIIKPNLTAVAPNEVYFPIEPNTVFPINMELTLLLSGETGDPIVGAEITVSRSVRMENNGRTELPITFKKPTITSSSGTIKLRIPVTANTLFFAFKAGNESVGVYFVQRHPTLAMGRGEDDPSNAGVPRNFMVGANITEPHSSDHSSDPDEDGLIAIEPQDASPDADGENRSDDIFPPLTRLKGRRIEEMLIDLEGQIPRNLPVRLQRIEEGVQNLETLEAELTSAASKLGESRRHFDEQMAEWERYSPRLAEYVRSLKKERLDLVGDLGTEREKQDELFAKHLERVRQILLEGETRASEARDAYSARFALMASEANRVFSELHTKLVSDSVAAIAAATAEQKRVLSEHARRLRKRIPPSYDPEPALAEPEPPAAEPALPAPVPAPQADDPALAPTELLLVDAGTEPPEEKTPQIIRRRRRSIVPGIVLGSVGLLLTLGTILMLALR